MAIVKSVWNAHLRSPGDADALAELSVVRQDRNDEILFSIVESGGAVRRRVTFGISSGQAMGLARFLAGISTPYPTDLDDEMTPTTFPGRPPSIHPVDPEPETED